MLYETIVKKAKIEKGWSADQKYCVTTQDNKKYLLRISDKERFERKQQEFEHMQKVAALGIRMCQPIEFGMCDEGVYSLQSFIDGVPVEESIKNISEDQQYAYGVEAGQILRKIHTIPAYEGIESWEKHFNEKIDRKLKYYKESGLQYDFMEYFLEYTDTHRDLLKNRPQSYQHGDYHIGNMMLDQAGKLYIIDFDRDDFGDPWEEFNRIVWSAQNSHLFASGIVNGYFNDQVPLDFWKLLVLYISNNTISSIPWAFSFSDEEVEIMIKQAKEILSWYDNMNQVIPTWYRKPTD